MIFYAKTVPTPEEKMQSHGKSKHPEQPDGFEVVQPQRVFIVPVRLHPLKLCRSTRAGATVYVIASLFPTAFQLCVVRTLAQEKVSFALRHPGRHDLTRFASRRFCKTVPDVHVFKSGVTIRKIASFCERGR